MSVKTDVELAAAALVIKSETIPLANSETRVGGFLEDLNSNKVNIDKISNNIASDAASVTKVPTVKEVVDYVAASSGSVINAKVSLTSAEILNLFTTPKVAILAPGVGKIIRILGVTFKYNFGTIAYSTNSLRVVLNSSIAISITNILNGSSSSSLNTSPLTSLGSVAFADWENQSIKIDVLAQNPTAGDGTVEVYISYTIITL